MRFSEAAGLRWGDLDLDAGTVTLRENKTDDPRTWALAPGVADALRTWRVMRIDGKPADHVFTDEHARPLTNEHHAETFRRHLLAAGVTREALFGSGKGSAPIRLHDLRATFVTLSLAAGRSEAWVADRTGHKSSVMINRYRRAARTAEEIKLGSLRPLAGAIPELFCPSSAPPFVGHEGLEPSASGLRVRCSTN